VVCGNDSCKCHRMRKQIVSPLEEGPASAAPDWLDLESLARVEVSSEHPDHPVEKALARDGSGEWRAGGPGVQTLRVVFDKPQTIRRIRLHFEELANARTQEFVLRSSTDGIQSFRELVRQQWNFSPEGATKEVEDYDVGLTSVTALELRIIPDINGGNAVAALRQLRLA
jgi:hypothetical protein